MCPRSIDPLYTLIYNIKRVTTSWTYSRKTSLLSISREFRGLVNFFLAAYTPKLIEPFNDIMNDSVSSSSLILAWKFISLLFALGILNFLYDLARQDKTKENKIFIVFFLLLFSSFNTSFLYIFHLFFRLSSVLPKFQNRFAFKIVFLSYCVSEKQ